MKLDDIFLANSHFGDGKIKGSSCRTKRKIFNTLTKSLASQFIVSLQGLRRVGKTVLLSQLADYYIAAKKLPVTNFLRFSFDLEDNIEFLPRSELDDLLKLYFELILKIHPQSIKEPILVALDEIQNVANWQNVVKKYYDLNPNIKFIVTGSSSLFLNEQADSLAGRIIEHKIPCLDFEEFLILSNSGFQISGAADIRSLQGTPARPVSLELINAFEHFFLIGGFPDTAIMHSQGNSVAEIQDFIRKSVIGKIIRKDLKRYYNIADSNIDYRLFELCCNESGAFFEHKKIASEVGLSETSVKRHLDIFAQSSLVFPLNKFDRKLRREIRATRKLYVASPSLMYSMAYKQTCEDSAFVGHAAETYAFNKLVTYSDRLYVYKGKSITEEIDFYLPDFSLLIESKYSNKIDARDFGFLNSQAHALKANSLVLTKSTFGNTTFNAVPLMFL